MEPDLDLLKDQKHASRLLGALLKSGRLPHALLFTGIAGSGKRDAAVAFAMRCNCRGENAARFRNTGDAVWELRPCGACRPCRKIVSGNHPDVTLVDPGGASIKIERIRRLCHALALKPYEAHRRIAVLADAHRMTPEAANALLKVLEEPPPQTLLILTAAQRSDLLPTVASRSHPVRFHPLPEDRIIKALQRRCGLSAETAALPAAMAHGSLSRALAMAETTTGTDDWLQRRDALLSATGLDHPDPFTFESLVLSLAFAERISGEKARIPEMLDILQTVLRDLMALRCHSSNRFNKDLTQKLQYVSQHTRREVLLAQLKAVQQTQREMAVNIHPRLALESLMLRLRNACHEKNRRHPL